MIFLLFGEDKFQIHQKKEEILRELSKKNKNFEVFSFDLEIEDWDKIQTHFKSSSFFSPLKIIVLQNPEKNKKFKESFLQEIEKYKASRNLILIIIQEGKEKEFISLVKKYSRWWHFSYLQELELKKWIKDKFKKNSLQPDPEIVDFLVLKFGSNLWAIENEIQKIFLLSKSGKFDKKEYFDSSFAPFEDEIFYFVNLLAEKKTKEALSFLRKALFVDKNLSYLLPILKTQFRDLLYVKSLLSEKSGNFLSKIEKRFHPFRAKKLIELSKRLDFSNLKEIYFRLFELETKIKKGANFFPTLISLLKYI